MLCTTVVYRELGSAFLLSRRCSSSLVCRGYTGLAGRAQEGPNYIYHTGVEREQVAFNQYFDKGRGATAYLGL